MPETGHKSRLAEIAERDVLALDSADRARIVEYIHNVGPTVVRKARVMNRIRQAGQGLALVTLIGVGLMALPRTNDEGSASSKTAAAIANAPCQAWAPAHGQFEFGSDKVSRLDLGKRALVVADEDTHAHIVKSTPCGIVFALESGRVTIHARNLGGGEFRVQTKAGAVAVRGTVFSVEYRDQLLVEVAEGQVDVSSRTAEVVRVKAHRQISHKEK